jgi:membrane-associated phospholipid phosphatase
VNAKDAAGNTSTFTTIIKRVDQDNSDVVLDWNATLLNAIYTDKTAPPVASRNMAIAQTAVFDAINSITGTYKNYHFTGTAPTIVSAEAAAASAAYTVLVNLYPNQKTFFDTALTASLAKITDGEAETTGVTFGQTVANDILTLRSTDGFNTTVNYTPGTNPGDWQPTPPANASALLPQWGQVTPFGLTSGSQFRPAGEPVLTSDQYTTDFNQVKDLGSINSTTRTADQTEVAKFWADGSGTFTPPGHWNQIAQNAAATKGNSLVDNARLFALLDISLADAGIAAWDAKYTENFWRPITAIQKADTDGNPNTTADPNWKPLITTPPFPSYISGHSTFSGAAAKVLTTILGDNVSFSVNSLGTPGVDRTFTNFNAAANEAGISRIYGGIHFNSDNVDGLATGKLVGNYVLQNLLAPITEPVQKLSVMPGEQLKLESQDIFGKNANFALESKQSLPTGMLDSDGTLIFKPTPDQIGTYDFTLVARDGQQVTTKKFNLAVVADTLTTTRISGVIQNTDQKALSGVVVKIGDVSATTSADGSFTLTLAGVPSADAALIIQPSQQVDNIVYPSIAEKLPLLLGHDVYANVKNVIDRPIFLPPIDISNAQTINPAITQTVTSAAILGSSVKVAANTLFDQENKPYTGKLSITTVPTELTPAALPDNLRPDLVVTIQPGEMNFRTPAPLSLPNIAGYAAGTQMDLWSINPQTGFFDKVGVGQVSADGKVINQQFSF